MKFADEVQAMGHVPTTPVLPRERTPGM